MPNTGPSEGSRNAAIHFLPILFKPKLALTVVTVLPTPALVGDIAVTKIKLFFFMLASFKTLSSILALFFP